MSTLGSSTTGAPPVTGNGQDTSSTAGQAKEKVQETAQQAAGQARGRLREQVDQRSTQAGEQVSTTVSDVRSVAEQLRQQGKDQPAKLAEQAADRAEKVGDYLKNADGDAILRDVEDFGRRQPWAVMFGGLAAGFLASRFLKASSSRRYESGYQSSYQGARGVQSPAGPGVVPPATSVPPATTSIPPTGTVPPASPGTVPAPGAGAPATGADVSLSGGVLPAGSPGETRPTGPAGGTR
jgi:hypothetical protein